MLGQSKSIASVGSVNVVKTGFGVARVLPTVSEPDPPTVVSMIRCAVENDIDRIMLVQLPSETMPCGIVVILIGHQAIMEVVPTLTRFYQVKSPSGHKTILSLPPMDSALHVFNWLKEENRVSSEAVFRMFDEDMVLAGFLGNELCAALSIELHKLGVTKAL